MPENDEKKKRIMLLDGSGIIYRAYFAFIKRPLTTSRGENTSAIFGFLKILIQIIREFRPDVMITAFDLSRDTFRTEIFSGYKAHRDETPKDLKDQIPVMIDILNLMHIPVIEMAGYEADDIIGSLSERLKNENEVFIISSDKDLLQLVDKNVKVIRPQQGIAEINLVDNNGVRDIMGVESSQIPDYLAIVGDSSDNIPGVKGIGEKGAVQLLNEYHSIEKIYENIDNIKGVLQKKLIENKENALLSKRLAQIKMDLEISENIFSIPFSINGMINPEVIRKLEHYQITSIIADLKKITVKEEYRKSEENLFDRIDPVQEIPALKLESFSGNYGLITKKSELLSLIERCNKRKCISIDTETTSANPTDADLIGISLSLDEGEGYFIPVSYDIPKEFDAGFVIDKLKPMLEDPEICKIGQNAKFEMEIFKNENIEFQGISFDTMLAAYLINPVRTHNNLESLVQEYLGFKKKDYSEVLKIVAGKDKTLKDVPIDDVVNYACSDSDAALRLKNKLEPLIEEYGLRNVLYNIEMPLACVLAIMERNGVKIDTARLNTLSGELDRSIKDLEEKIYYIAGKKFNINSPVQLSKLLFEEIGLESVKKTGGGKNSTDEEVLNTLAFIHPLPAEILKYRTYAKLKGTYVDSLPELISKRTGRIHTSFNQTVAATGRLSSSDPNLQNIPIRDEIGKKIREAFIAEEGCVLISADYSQIELRFLAHFCEDENMKKAFYENLDIHSHTASLIFKVQENDVNEEQRRKAKSVNFGIIYGLQSYGLSRQLGIPISEAKIFIDSYFENFPKVRIFVENILNEVKETGEVRTLSGRYRKFPDLKGREIKPGGQLNSSQRMALNAKIQGSAADVIKIAMINIQRYIEENHMKTKMILQIHDELILEAPQNEVEAVKTAVKKIMEEAYKLNVPLVVDIGTGKNWSEAH